jgi:hypothetical protein
MAVKLNQKGIERIAKHALQLAALRDDALIAGCEAFDERKVGLGRAYDIAKVYLRRWLRQS